MKAYDENAKYILFINKSITILGCSTVNSLTIGFLGHITQHEEWEIRLGQRVQYCIFPKLLMQGKVELAQSIHQLDQV